MCSRIGDGRTKQEAKRQAARLMYDKIIVLSQEESMTSSIEENQDTCDYQIPSTILLNDNKSLQENSKLIKNFDASEALNSMDMFFNQLKLSTKPYISNLKVIRIIYLILPDEPIIIILLFVVRRIIII